MLTITPSRSSIAHRTDNAAPAVLAQIHTTVPMIGATNVPEGNTGNVTVSRGMVSADNAVPLQARQPAHPLRARFVSSFVFASRKLLLNRIYNGWLLKREGAALREHPQNASSLLKATAREMKGILTSLDSPTPCRTNQKQRQRVKGQLSETDKHRLYGEGRLSVDQRLMLYALPNIKTFVEQCDQDFAYAERDISSSRRLLYERTVKVVLALDDKVGRMEKLLVDTYMQHEHHVPSGVVLAALLEPEVVGRLLEITRGLNSEQQRAAALTEIRQICEAVGKHHPEIAHSFGTLISVRSTLARLNMPSVAPAKPPRKAPSETAVTASHSPPMASTDSHLSRNEAFQKLLRSFPSYTKVQADADSVLPVSKQTFTDTQAHRADRQGPVSIIDNMMGRFKTLFSAARKSCTPDWESRTVQRQWQAQRVHAATVAYDKIAGQANDIWLALNTATHAADTPHSARDGHCHDQPSRVAGPALDFVLHSSKLTVDLGSQLSLQALLSAGDSHALQLATTYGIDAAKALEAGGRLRPDQRGILYGLDALVNAMAQLPTSLKQPDSAIGVKFAQARDALARLVDLQDEAHDTLTYTCVMSNLSTAERMGIFNDRTVAHLMEATAGQAPDQHDAICKRLVEKARQAYQDPRQGTRDGSQ